jgi:hypothetical protein
MGHPKQRLKAPDFQRQPLLVALKLRHAVFAAHDSTALPWLQRRDHAGERPPLDLVVPVG